MAQLTESQSSQWMSFTIHFSFEFVKVTEASFSDVPKVVFKGESDGDMEL